MKKNLIVLFLVCCFMAFGAVQKVRADALMFPYVITSSTVTTLLTVVHHDIQNNSPQLHYAYFYKTDPYDQDEICDEGNFWRDTTPEDVVTFDVGGHFGSATGGVLFNDPTNYGGAAFNVLTAVSPTRAFVLVDDANGVRDAELYGEALLIEFVSGAAWGYRAYNSTSTSSLNPSMTDGFEVQGEVLDGNEFAPIHLMPLNEFQTLFFVTPVGTGGGGQDFGGYQVTVRLFDTAQLQNLVAWDRDENPVSGIVEDDKTCVGAVTAEGLMTALAQSLLQDGGWTYMDTEPGPGTGARIGVDEAVIFKLEYNKGATLNGEALSGVINTALWLRDNAGFIRNQNNPGNVQVLPGGGSGVVGRRQNAGGIDGF
jgi:hypothetical protein